MKFYNAKTIFMDIKEIEGVSKKHFKEAIYTLDK